MKVVRRDDGGKDFISVENIGDSIKNLLDVVQKSMLEKATRERDSCIVQARSWDEFMAALNNKKLVMAPWCDEKVAYLLNVNVSDNHLHDFEISSSSFVCA